MTVIVALEEDGKVWMGSDSFIGDDSWRDVSDTPKHFIRGELLFGFAGDIHATQVVEDLVPPRHKAGEDDYGYLKRVSAAIRKLHEKNKLTEKPDFSGLIGYRGKVYILFDDYGLHHSERGYAATGAGEQAACGALFAAKGREPKARILVALKAAATHSNAVCPPYRTISL
jgi:ATP-dependent protease HslVU (ClpYQ) peptidase subunit